MAGKFEIDVEKFNLPATRGDVAGIAIGALLSLQEATAALVAVAEGKDILPHLKDLTKSTGELRDMVGKLIAEDAK